ncbi:MAG TPA: hypothetical protein VK911_03165 [Vicinamibacterales bacterium]|nr:hypothetical protein [Vicinamibacterales bacterium]
MGKRQGTWLAVAAMIAATASVAAAVLFVAHAGTTGPQPGRRGPVRAEGDRFVAADGRPFEWRGVTAFALLHQVVDGREAEAEAFLRWASGRGFTVVRVLGMAHNLFPLSADEGLKGVRRLLRLAADHGLMVELVLFADTQILRGLDFEAHAGKVAAEVSGATNVFIELANENDHGAQDRRLTDAGQLQAIRARLPREIPVSLGSLHAGDLRVVRYEGGDYVTVHIDRSAQPWQHVGLTARLGALARGAGTPVVNDEPIGAGERLEPGRRLADPGVFYGFGVLSRLTGVPTTFHCEDCMYARPLGKTQEASAAAFIEGTRLLPEGRRFLPVDPVAGGSGAGEGRAHPLLKTREVPGGVEVHAAADESGDWVVVAALGAPPDLALPWAPGWSVTPLASRPGIVVYRAGYEKK